MFFRHALPGAGVAVLKRETLGVRTVAQDRRIVAFGDRAEHVGPEHEPIIHRDRHIPIDAHAVAHLTAGLVRFMAADGRHACHARFAFQ